MAGAGWLGREPGAPAGAPVTRKIDPLEYIGRLAAAIIILLDEIEKHEEKSMPRPPSPAAKALAKAATKPVKASKKAPPKTKVAATASIVRPKQMMPSPLPSLTIWDTTNRRSRIALGCAPDGSVGLVYFPKRSSDPGGATYISKNGVRKVATLYVSQPFVDQLILTDPSDRKTKTVIDCHGIGLNVGRHFFHIPTGPKQRANLAKFFAAAKAQA